MAAPAASPATAATAAVNVNAQSLYGEWQIQGPVSTAPLVQLMALSFQAKAPTAAEMTAAGVGPSLQERVLETRAELARNPQNPDMVELRQNWEAVSKTRLTITPKTLETRTAGTLDAVPYTLLSAGGNQVSVRMEKPGAPPLDVVFTFTSLDQALMGPLGQEPLVLARVRK